MRSFDDIVPQAGCCNCDSAAKVELSDCQIRCRRRFVRRFLSMDPDYGCPAPAQILCLKKFVAANNRHQESAAHCPRPKTEWGCGMDPLAGRDIGAKAADVMSAEAASLGPWGGPGAHRAIVQRAVECEVVVVAGRWWYSSAV